MARPPRSLLGIAAFLSGEVAAAELAAESALADPEGLASLHASFQRRALRRDPEPSEGERRRLGNLSAEIDSLVDEALLYGAAARLGEALDASLPILHTLVAGREPIVGATASCDTLDTPAICIGGTGPNTYGADHRLIIDLGGDDTDTNSAGGADPGLASAVTGGGGNGLVVSVNVDLGGNDTYSTELATASGSHVAQGGGFLGGIGILVDEGGNDVYEIRSLKSHPESYGALGQGFAEYGSVGVLRDFGGDDSYSLVSHSWDPVGAYGVAFGHGLGGAGAIGLLLEGSGNDSYLAEHQPTPRLLEGGVLHLGAPTVISGGAAAEGVGVLADGGGTDQMTARASTVPIAADDPTPFETPPAVYAEAFGFSGIGGVGVALSGDGSTSWSVRGESRAPRTTGVNVWGFGATSFGSYAAVDDLGGDDSYSMDSVAEADVSRAVSDDCGCEGVTASASAVQAFIGGGGHGAVGSIGVMFDHAGADRYRFNATNSANAVARDDRVNAVSGGANAEAVGELGAIVESLGFGLLGGTGLALDGDGDDRYEVEARATSSADASAASLDSVAEATAVARNASTAAFGASVVGGHGEQLDSGGRDEYRSMASSSATASPATHEETGESTSSVLGSVDLSSARFADLDGGAADAFSAAPGDPACQGVKGQDVWLDCGIGGGTGVNR